MVFVGFRGSVMSRPKRMLAAFGASECLAGITEWHKNHSGEASWVASCCVAEMGAAIGDPVLHQLGRLGGDKDKEFASMNRGYI